MPRLFAPAGATTFSHGGHEFEIAEDGAIDVDERVAVDLRAHGFKDVPPPPSETVVVSRAHLVALMEKAGAAVNPDMAADKLAAALAATVAKDTKKATLTLGAKPAAAT